MIFSPLTKQIFVACAPQLAAVTVGGTTMLPAVLLSQLQSNNSTILPDQGTASWIGSIHGLAGTLSVVMPTVMQLIGRKLAFLISCILIVIGWILIYYADEATIIIVGECFHGLGSNIFHIVGLLAISELVSPALRSIFMPLLNVSLVVGMSAIHTIGCFLHWKSICLIFCVPIIIAMAIVYFWPESPFWLAYRGQYEKCEQVFTWLRGTDEESRKELSALIKSEMENFKRNKRRETIKNFFWRELIIKVTRRSFYMPLLHITMIMSTFYWSGNAATYILSSIIFKQAAQNESATLLAIMIINPLSIVCASVSCFTIKYFKTKTVMLSSIFSVAVFLLLSSVVTFCQTIGILSRDSILYLICWVGHNLSNYCGWFSLSFSLSAEIIPVQHRDSGGAFYIILSCVLHSATLKIIPHMFKLFDLWGTYLIFFITSVIGFVFVWKCIPETRGRTLIEIETFYSQGHFNEHVIEEQLASVNLGTVTRSYEHGVDVK